MLTTASLSAEGVLRNLTVCQEPAMAAKQGQLQERQRLPVGALPLLTAEVSGGHPSRVSFIPKD